MENENSSWRKIQQQLSGPAITATAQNRRRFVLQKRVIALLVIVALVAGGTWCAYYLSTHSKTFAPYATDQGRTHIVFFSDGQLTPHWFDETFANLKQKELLSIDIAGLQSALLKNPQVLEATVERHFPKTLKVTLKERLPIGRVKLKLSGKIQVYYVARDGQLFTSPLYRAPANLPFISNAAIHEVDGQLAPLSGTLTLGELLDGLKTKFPDLSIQLSQIDLADWQFPINPQTSVCLQTRGGTKLRFGPEKIDVQLSRLKETIDMLAAEKQTLKNKTIDMTYPDKVAVMGGGK